MSLYRLGVPHECLTGLIGIDETGKTVIRTPKARRVWDLLMGSDLSTSYERAADVLSTLWFFCKRGVGQGDKPSPYVWNSFFDILLVALKLGVTGSFWVRTKNHMLTTLDDISYADDLNTPATDKASLQRKADIVSAFTMICGFTISISKLRTLLMSWGNEIPSPGVDESFVVHEWAGMR